jgi:hypothetical protein
MLITVVNFSQTAVWVFGILFVVELSRKCRSKKKMFVSRSVYASDMAMVEGSATKSQRLFVYGVQLAFILFWLAFVFGALTLLDSELAFALSAVFFMSCGLLYGVTAIGRGRADALRKLEQKRAC